jgi:hypothetical protein
VANGLSTCVIEPFGGNVGDVGDDVADVETSLTVFEAGHGERTSAVACDDKEPFRAFPSWFMRITCDRCGKDRMLSETHTPHGDMLIQYCC